MLPTNAGRVFGHFKMFSPIYIYLLGYISTYILLISCLLPNIKAGNIVYNETKKRKCALLSLHYYDTMATDIFEISTTVSLHRGKIIRANN
jgi:hypothetical protein